jgi:hypothetical protein
MTADDQSEPCPECGYETGKGTCRCWDSGTCSPPLQARLFLEYRLENSGAQERP